MMNGMTMWRKYSSVLVSGEKNQLESIQLRLLLSIILVNPYKSLAIEKTPQLFQETLLPEEYGPTI
jgi:hypothetical protein